MTHSSYSSIEQLRHLVKDVEHYFPAGERPTLEFYGTVKLHGTNAGIGYNGKDIWAQSRSNIITTKQDNAGFAFFLETNKEYFIDIMKKVVDNYNIDMSSNNVILFGEWCGTGIQKGVAISKLPRMFVAFDIKIVPQDDKLSALHKPYYINTLIPEVVNDYEKRIFNIHQFPTFKIIIDFNDVSASTNQLNNIVTNVEKTCPFGNMLGVDGVGEGVVFRHYYNEKDRYIFKLKGDEHKVSKEKVKVEIAPEVIANINVFCDRVVTENRFTQAQEYLYRLNPSLPTYNKTPELSHIGKFIKWFQDDIWKEEMDVMVANNLDPNMVYSEMAKRVTTMVKALVNQ